jgi:hypothetical protein
MSIGIRAVGLSLSAVAVAAALAAMTASASTGGHLVAPVHTSIGITEVPGTTHQLEFTVHGFEGGIVCDEVSYPSYTTTSETETQLVTTPTYKKCHTTGAAADTTTFNSNACAWRYTVGVGGSGTVDLVCTPGFGIVIKHPNCEWVIPPQNNIGTLTYTTTTENGVHTLTIDLNAQLAVTQHFGICVFTGTNKGATIKGSITARGFSTSGLPVGLTAT